MRQRRGQQDVAGVQETVAGADERSSRPPLLPGQDKTLCYVGISPLTWHLLPCCIFPLSSPTCWQQQGTDLELNLAFRPSACARVPISATAASRWYERLTKTVVTYNIFGKVEKHSLRFNSQIPWSFYCRWVNLIPATGQTKQDAPLGSTCLIFYDFRTTYGSVSWIYNTQT